MLSQKSFVDKGYMPLAWCAHAAIAWQGEPIKDFWMWNRLYVNAQKGGRMVSMPQTVQVRTLKDAALRYWRDGWVPVAPVDESLLRRFESELRAHRGLKARGVKFPEGNFLMPSDKPPPDVFCENVNR